MLPTQRRCLQELCAYSVVTLWVGFHLPLSLVMGGVLSGFSLLLGIKLTDNASYMNLLYIVMQHVSLEGVR